MERIILEVKRIIGMTFKNKRKDNYPLRLVAIGHTCSFCGSLLWWSYGACFFIGHRGGEVGVKCNSMQCDV